MVWGGPQAAAWLWQRLPGSLSICKTAGKIGCDPSGGNVVGDTASTLPPDLPSLFPAHTYVKRTDEVALGRTWPPGTGELNNLSLGHSELRKNFQDFHFFPNDLDTHVLWPSLAQCLHLWCFSLLR